MWKSRSEAIARFETGQSDLGHLQLQLPENPLKKPTERFDQALKVCGHNLGLIENIRRRWKAASIIRANTGTVVFELPFK